VRLPTRTFFISGVLTLALVAFTAIVRAADAPTQPNIVIILADDLGWSDTTLYGTTTLYKTPNIERLAARGMTFTHAYSASPLCSPTRSAILTGLHPARTGLTTPNCHIPQVTLTATPGVSAPPSNKSVGPTPVSRLKTQYDTLAERLQEEGYATGHFGKWHLGSDPYSPLQHGFDVDIPHWPGPGPAGSFVAPWKFPDFDPNTPDEHIEDRMAQEATAFMEQHRDEPFFLNYWMFSVHAPFNAKKSLIDQYRQQVNANNPQRSPTYAAMIESMDDAVGTLMDTLDRLAIADTTIVIFASDNGGNMYDEVDGTTPTSNAPLRGGKATIYEGGIRCPMSVVWPSVVKAGSRSDAVTQSTDFYPTILEMLNLDAKADQSFDGISIVPALKQQPLVREAIFTYFPHDPKVPEWLPPSVSVHRDDWKLIRIFFGGDEGAHRWKLFNLKEDIGEKHNLADRYPSMVKELDGLIETFLVETKAVRPVINPNFDPTQYRIEDEGVKRMGRQATKKSFAKPVAGWQASSDCTLALKQNSLHVTCQGNDPYLSYRLPKPTPANSLKLQISSTADGIGQIFWKEQGGKQAFSSQQSQSFEINHDGKPHVYEISLTAKKPIVAVRIDPARSPGTVQILSAQINDEAKQSVHTWDFTSHAP
jgi:arylsulfatase A-like enzyme